VHIFREGREVGRWDIEHQRTMDEFLLTRRLAQALKEAGYMTDKEE
jgi:hypothetical protein